MAEELLLRLSARAGAYTFLDVPSKIEVLALGSFSCCLLGSLSTGFPLPVNLAVALLALLACRARSEAQLAGLCGFGLFTIITDIIAICTRPTGWGGTMTAFNIFLKLSVAGHAYRLCDALGALDDMAPVNGDEGAVVAGGGGSGAAVGYPTAYHAPVASMSEDDLATMSAEAADLKHSAVGEVTRYRAI